MTYLLDWKRNRFPRSDQIHMEVLPAVVHRHTAGFHIALTSNVETVLRRVHQVDPSQSNERSEPLELIFLCKKQSLFR